MSINQPLGGLDGSPANAAEYNSALTIAIKAGNLQDVQRLLGGWRSDKSIPDPSSQDITYLVPRAAEGDGRPAILGYLLSQGGQIGAYAIGQTTSPAIFQVFIDHGWKPDNQTLLSHIAHPDLVSLFLSYGVDPAVANNYGFYPLDAAAASAPLESVRILLDHGASPSSPRSHSMNAAAQSDVPSRIDVLQLLLEHGADINALADDYPAPSEAMKAGREGTPLHAAAKWGNKEVMAWLLKQGADVNVKNEVGLTYEEWGKRFESDGPERILRLRRAINRKQHASG